MMEDNFKTLTIDQVHAALSLAEVLRARNAERKPVREAVMELYERQNIPRNSLEAFLLLLPREAFCELVALMWWGRGNEFWTYADAVKHALRCNPNAAHIAEQGARYVLGKSTLVKHLRQGIVKLQNPPAPPSEGDEEEDAA